MKLFKAFSAQRIILSLFIVVLISTGCNNNTQFRFKSSNSSFETKKSTPLTRDAAKGMVGMYLNSGLYKSNIIVNDSGKSIMALEFDSVIINKIRRDTSVHGLRVYFGRHVVGTDSLYTLIAVPTDINGINAADSGFEWHTPCPPCTVAINRVAVPVGKIDSLKNPLNYHN